MPEPVSLRQLNRATLSRQGLIEPFPKGSPPEQVVERVGPLQAQYNPSPFLAVRARTVGVTPDVIHRALDDYRLVKASLYRQTLHLVSGAEYPEYATACEAIRGRTWDSYLGRLVDPEALRLALARFTRRERSHDEIIEFIDTWMAANLKPQAELPDTGSWFMVRAWSWMMRTPATTRVDYHGRDGYLAGSNLAGGTDVDPEEAWVNRVRAYLGAFGPASTDDIMSFTAETRVTRVRAAIAALGDEVVELVDPDGVVVHDLAGAPRPDPDVPVPVRMLPRFDSLLLAYAVARRRRVTPDAHYDAVMKTRNAQVLASVLVDGFVAGTWEAKVDRRGVEVNVTPLEKWPGPVRAEVVDEAERVAAFLAGGRSWRAAVM